jgi:hypothetical protein
MDDNVTVRIVGDASAVQPAVEQTESSLGGIQGIIANISGWVDGLIAKFGELGSAGAASGTAMAAGMEKAEVAASHAGASIGTMSERLHMGGLTVGLFEKAFAPLAEAVAAAFAIDKVAEFIDHMAEGAEKIQHLSQEFGMTAAQIQQLQGVATATGVPIDALTRGMAFLDRNMANAAMGAKNTKQAMDAVGISMNDGRDQMAKLETVADKFANMADGPKKVALAMQLFGRSGKELIPILNLGAQGIEELNQKMDDYGVRNEEAAAKGAILAENVNETKLGFMGIDNVLMDALAPAFTELVAGINSVIQAFVQSYDTGGIVYVVFQTIADVIQGLVEIVEELGSIFSAIWGVISDVVSDIGHDIADVFGISIPGNVNTSKLVMNEFKDLLEIVGAAVKTFVDSAGLGFRVLAQVIMTFGKIAYDALTLNWGSIEGDWNKGMNRLVAIVDEGTKKVVADAQQMAAALQAAANGEAVGGTPKGVKFGKGGGDFDYNPTAPGKKGKKGGAKDDLVQKLEEELEAKKAAWAMEQDAQGTFQQYSLQSEADYWAAALKMTNLSAKDKLAIEQKYLAARQALKKDEIAQQLEAYQEDLDHAGANWNAKLAILQKEQAFIVHMYGAESAEARKAAQEIVKAEEEKKKQLEQINAEIVKAKQQAALAGIDQGQAAAEFEVEMGRMSKNKLLELEKQFENQRYSIERQGIEQRIQLMKLDPAMDPVKLQQLYTQLEALDQQHQAKLTKIDQQAVLQRTQIERTAIQQISSTWGQNIGQMLTLQESFAQGVKNMWQGLVQAIGNAIGSIIEQWLEQQLAALILGKSQTQATNAASVVSYAGVAGAAGVASMAAAPFPIDLTAPEFGASMSALALGYASLASFDVGAWDLSKDQPAMVHAGEMIIPANLAGGMRELFKNAANSNSPATAAHEGTLNFHYSPTIHHGGREDVVEAIEKQGRDFRRYMKREFTNGNLRPKSVALG